MSGAAQSDEDRRFMRAALAFGRRFLGQTGTNPAVGALVVKDGVMIGRGATLPGGRPHAETEALRQAGEAARGATLYVTLEPCSHQGVTPPCADAIVRAGIARVVSAMEDPDPRVSGRGHGRLREAKVETIVGVCETDARRAHRGHIMRATAGRPMVTLKLAETADGFAAGEAHDPRLRITGAAADHRVHMLRALHDAIMVGAGTMVVDDPLLTVRLPGMEARRPLRIVLDRAARLPLGSRLLATAGDWPLLAVIGEDAPAEAAERLRTAGALVQRAPAAAGAGAGLDLESVLRALAADHGLTHIFCEGGPTLASRLLVERLADEAILFRGRLPLGRPGLPALSQAARAALRVSYAEVDAGRAGADHWQSFERLG